MSIKGKKVLVSGTFAGVDDVAGALRGLGAEVVTKFSMDVEIVFEGKGATGDVDNAIQFGIPVRDAAALEALLAGKEVSAPRAPAAFDYDDSYMHSSDQDDYDPGYVAMASQPVNMNDRSAPSRGQKERPANNPSTNGDREELNFERGDRVKIVSGLEGVGVVGEIFWWGESRYGEGMRAGVRGPGDDESYWVDAIHLGYPDDDIPEEVMEAAKEASKFGKGDRVRVVEGRDAGSVGVIFWWGESKFGDGMRAGIETDSGEKVWADAAELEASEDGGGSSNDSYDDGGFDDDIPF